MRFRHQQCVLLVILVIIIVTQQSAYNVFGPLVHMHVVCIQVLSRVTTAGRVTMASLLTAGSAAAATLKATYVTATGSLHAVLTLA
jgi:hypothetical protein